MLGMAQNKSQKIQRHQQPVDSKMKARVQYHNKTMKLQGHHVGEREMKDLFLYIRHKIQSVIQY